MAESKKIEDFTEIDFVHTVMTISSQVFSAKEKRFLGKTRLVKLVAFAADKLGFPLTRGWYRYGYYAPVPNQQISQLLDRHQTFENFPKFQERYDENMRNAFGKAVLILKPYFVKEEAEFDKWVHEEMAPAPYRKYYRYETLLYDRLICIRDVILNKEQFGTEFSDFSEIITNFERSLDFVEDSKVLKLLHEYVDFWELLVLRIQNRGATPQMAPLVSELVKIYHKYLRPALTPYEETLQGMNAEQEKDSFRRQISSNLRTFKEQFEFYKDIGKSRDLVATLEEIREDLKQRTVGWGEEKKKNFRTILLEYIGGYT
ncbi:MAG: hypothetical protein PVF58_13725 [Candidatus Methanofastidiosia archaeon]|jgi:hypothetical protein